MSQLECPSCRLRIQALGAPTNCPRCLVRKGERVGLIPAGTSVSESPAAPVARQAVALRHRPLQLRPGAELQIDLASYNLPLAELSGAFAREARTRQGRHIEFELGG
jgi:hypothetical protein